MKRTDAQFDQDSTPIAEQAARWWVVLNEEGCTAADREAFAVWVQRSPERVEAFLRMSMVSSALHSSEIRWPDTPMEDLIQQARAATAKVIPLHHASKAATGATEPVRNSLWRRNTRRFLAASAAALFAAAWVLWTAGPDRYRTGLGEQRSVVLGDGSIVTLNTSSEIGVEYGEERRFIRLRSGEALFNVAHDVARPFDVAAGNITVRAVGTQFNVDRRADRTTVTVVEGTVRVSTSMDGPQRTAPGSNRAPAEPLEELIIAAQQIVVTPSGMTAPERVPDVAPVTAWTQRQLVFENQPLSEVTAEFNRYNRRRILIEAAELQSLRVTGVFQTNDSASLLAFISAIPGVDVQPDGDGHHVVSMQARGIEEFGAAGSPN